ncbi:MAG: DUF2268 domain-containing putative Zn-dependent protease [Candidatus Portnoybacteria bacterium]
MKTIKDNKKTIAYLSFYTDNIVAGIAKDEFIVSLVKDLPVSSVGYAGFREKDYLKNHLQWQIFGATKKVKEPFELNKKVVANIIEKAIKRCHRTISSEPTRIFVFPNFNPFVVKKMSGVAGYCPWQKTVHVYIYPVPGWKKSLENTVYHEFNHSIVAKYSKRKTLLDDIIIEGLAENFRESLSKTATPWVKAVPPKKSQKIFSSIKNLLKSKDYNTYHQLFFAGKKYPLWAGYSIGYQIVKKFIKNNKDLTWKKIVKIKPKIVFKKSGF